MTKMENLFLVVAVGLLLMTGVRVGIPYFTAVYDAHQIAQEMKHDGTFTDEDINISVYYDNEYSRAVYEVESPWDYEFGAVVAPRLGF